MGQSSMAICRRSVIASPLALLPWLARGAQEWSPGWVTAPLAARAETVRVAIAADGRLIVSATTTRQRLACAALLAFLPDGRPDAAFGTQGLTVVCAGGRGGVTSLMPNALALQADGRIVLAGECTTDEQYSSDFLAMRFLPDGQPDASFGEAGWTNTPIGGSHDMARAVVADADGGVVAVGGSLQRQLVLVSRYDFALVRYGADGRLDPRFGRGGKSVIRVGSVSEDFGYAAVIDAQRRILVTGRTHTQGAADVALLRVRPDGRLDRDFGKGGTVVTRFAQSGAHGSAVACQADGKILVAGSMQPGAIVMRHTPSGRLDAGFGERGVVRLAGVAGAAALAVQRDGRILVLGVTARTQRAWRSLVVARLLPSGRLDESFGAAGLAAVTPGTPIAPSGLAVSAAGEVFACASLSERFERSSADRAPGLALVKFTERGEADARFGTPR